MLLDPVGLFSEGQYNLNNIKEISVTDSFMGLDKNTRHCQNIETFNECKTRLHVENLRKECGCLPLTLELSEKVITKTCTKRTKKLAVSHYLIDHRANLTFS